MERGAWRATAHGGCKESDITELLIYTLYQFNTFLNKQAKIMASGPITSWQIDGEIVADFIFLGSKITADSELGTTL